MPEHDVNVWESLYNVRLLLTVQRVFGVKFSAYEVNQLLNNLIGGSLRVATSALAIALATVVNQSAHAQTFAVLHTFTGGQDGREPSAGLTMDKGGNLYSTAGSSGYTGGKCDPTGCGTVFKLTQKDSQWVFTPLYSFKGGDDGSTPEAAVTIGPDGILYGTTTYGGSTNGGTVYNLRPKPGVCKSALCPWVETVMYSFEDDCCSGDGIFPAAGVVLDLTYAQHLRR